MAETRVEFDDADAYDRYMGRWSRAIGEKFLAWIDAGKRLRWLDVGCGTGAFSSLILEQAAPTNLVGIDPSPQQVEHVRKTITARQAEFRIASALDLPFGSNEFDVVVSALVIHFIPDRPKGLREMLRVAKRGGLVAGYTWRRSPAINDAPYGPLARGLIEVGGEVTLSPTVAEAMPDGLRASLAAEGYGDIEVATIEASQTFRDFEDYWISQTATFPHPVAKSVAALSDHDRERLREKMRAALPAARDGSVTYSSRATTFKARKPS
jgi:SAM-dependent methyltransferase